MEVDLHLRAARPRGQMRNAETATPPGNEDDGDAAEDTYKEKGEGHSQAVNTKPEDVDDRIHCENLSLVDGAYRSDATYTYKFYHR